MKQELDRMGIFIMTVKGDSVTLNASNSCYSLFRHVLLDAPKCLSFSVLSLFYSFKVKGINTRVFWAFLELFHNCTARGGWSRATALRGWASWHWALLSLGQHTCIGRRRAGVAWVHAPWHCLYYATVPRDGALRLYWRWRPMALQSLGMWALAPRCCLLGTTVLRRGLGVCAHLCSVIRLCVHSCALGWRLWMLWATGAVYVCL